MNIVNWFKTPKNLDPTTLALRELTLQFRACLHYLRKQHGRFSNYRYRIPWLLCISPDAVGTESILENSEIPMYTLPTMGPALSMAHHFVWRVSSQAVFIDVPSICLTEDPLAQTLWQHFSKLLRHHRPRVPMNRVLLILDTATLCKMPEALFSGISRILRSLKIFKRNISVTALINKTDLLDGFNEYFADLSPEERRQSLGLQVHSELADTSLAEHFDKQFNALLERISRRLFPRLHQERSAIKRAHIKNFPLQLERLRPFLKNVMKRFPWDQYTAMVGVYFVSAKQCLDQNGDLLFLPTKTTSNESGLHPFSETASHEVIVVEAPKLNLTPRGFFIHDLLKEQSKLVLEDLVLQNPTQIWRQLLLYPLGALVVIVIAILWHFSYVRGVETLHEVNVGLKILQSVNPKQKEYWLVKLNALEKTRELLAHRPKTPLAFAGLDEANQLAHNADSAYAQLLQNTFVPYLENILSQHLQYEMTHHSKALYSTLEVYLMLSDPKEYSENTVKNWFAKVWQAEWVHHPKRQAALLHHLQFVLAHHLWLLQPDQALITQARETMLQWPLSTLTFLVVADQYSAPPTPLLGNANIPGLDLARVAISSFYSVENFSRVYNQDIPNISKTITTNNWVLGITNNAPAADSSDTATLIQEVRDLYLQQYSAHWEGLLNKIRFTKTTQFSDVQTAILLLSNNQSPLWQIVTLIAQNSTMKAEAPSDVSTASQQLKDWLSQGDNITALTENLQQLSAYISNITETPDLKNSAYVATMKHLAPQTTQDILTTLLATTAALPAPINQWVASVTRNTWHAMLYQSAQYLNQLWKTSVLPEYNSVVKNRYPIFANSSQDMTLTDFSQFFEPNGTIDAFLNYYLKPFIDTSHFYWTWKVMDGEKLPLSQNALESFLRANLIQKMFFHEGVNGPHTEFLLTPVGLTPNVAEFNLNMEGQIITVSATAENYPVPMQWPGSIPGFVNMRFDTTDGLHPTIASNGTWAWFRELQHATITTTSDPKQYTVVFSANHNEASLTLSTPDLVNPYIPNILDAFRCGDDLVSS